jgi:hypothetical protein
VVPQIAIAVNGVAPWIMVHLPELAGCGKALARACRSLGPGLWKFKQASEGRPALVGVLGLSSGVGMGHEKDHSAPFVTALGHSTYA